MQLFFFYFFAALAVISALLVVVNKNPVNGAMFMILSLVSMAGLFVLLEAFFLAVLQVLVYAGAVMVLFLFIIMLLDVDVAKSKPTNKLTLAASVVSGLLVVCAIGAAVLDVSALPNVETTLPPEVPTGADPMAFATSPRAFGYSLFTRYMLPFQLTGFLLLAAMVGVIVISKRFKGEDEENKSNPSNANLPGTRP